MSLYPNTPIPSPTPSIQYPAIPAYSPVLSGQGEVSSNPPTIQEQPSNSGTLNFQDPDVQDLVFGGSGSDLKSEEGDFAGRDWKRTEDVMHMSFSPPPSYISHDACVTEYKDPDVIAEIEDLVQDYLYSDLLMIDDTHTIFILDATQAVPSILMCEEHYHMGTHIPGSYYQPSYPPINPFFSDDKMEHLYAIAAVTEFHGEHQLTSTIDNALHMPYPNTDIMHALTQQNLLDKQQGSDTIAFAYARDRKLGIQ
ncbi:hypothetical protein EV424DRAFT_1536145 [Suillus variegatus]|nr:hypothetical protein EV424DRAFT_1536145 [Suillus variegatus]